MQEKTQDPTPTLAEAACDHFDLVKRLELTGLFTVRQLRLIEDELRAVAVENRTFGRVCDLRSGDQVGRFIVDELLACGGEGYVFRGHDSASLEPTAIKILDNFRLSKRFRREMQMVLQLAHPNIVTAYEVSEFHGVPFIAMELLPGPDLAGLIRDNGPLDWQTSTHYVLQIARALAHAHSRDLKHRDIKPGNIILSGDNNVKLVDLGLAAIERARDETTRFHKSKDAQLVGTLPFMAPEQARSSASRQSDIFSLGATWFYLLTAETRLPGSTLTEQFANLLIHRRFKELPRDCLPAELLPIFEGMVAYDEIDRYPNCDELSAELEQALRTAGEAVMEHTLSVLIVEDSQTDMFRTIEILRRTNQCLSIHQARTLAEGIEICDKVRADLVLLDLNLPDSLGAETVQRFRRWEPDIPIVVLTGTSNAEIHAACMKSGGTTFLSKLELDAQKIEHIIFVAVSRSKFTRNT